MWYEGTVTIKGTEYKYFAKVYDISSIFGINNSRISKLSIKDGKKLVVNYDRGWDVRPKRAAHKKTLEIILDMYK